MKKLEVGWEKFKETKFCRWLKEYWGLDDWIGLGIAIMGMLYYLIKDFPGNYPGWFTFYGNIHAELIGIGITVLILGNADQALRIRQEKQRLILQMGSPDNSFAIEAARQLRVRGWLFDGTLRAISISGAHLEKVDLSKSHLEGAYLEGCHLEESFLMGAYLTGTHMTGVNLKKASLWGAYLEGAYLTVAHLEGAYLSEACMKTAHLRRAHMEGTYLEGSDLCGVDLRKVSFNEDTKWTGAKYNKDTQWPEGFDPNAAGCILVEDE